jgi:hypothetical protein
MVCVHLMTERPLGADIFLPAFSHRRQRSFLGNRKFAIPQIYAWKL